MFSTLAVTNVLAEDSFERENSVNLASKLTGDIHSHVVQQYILMNMRGSLSAQFSEVITRLV